VNEVVNDSQGEGTSVKGWRRGAARCPSCSQNAHARKVLAWEKRASRRARGGRVRKLRAVGAPSTPPSR